ncbi:unnamed protein product [Allacma fusca]|uniref:Uncharacterized protein n=1 Tax=Allacma fusca TaxID=39272 RepID=A0A8J2K4L8_9HEXA|nr:unnamed protein product [Allacma fusca]
MALFANVGIYLERMNSRNFFREYNSRQCNQSLDLRYANPPAPFIVFNLSRTHWNIGAQIVIPMTIDEVPIHAQILGHNYELSYECSDFR